MEVINLKFDRGWFLFLLLFLTGLAGYSITGLELYLRLIYLDGLLLLVTWGWSKISLRDLHFLRKARSLRASAGDIFEETFELINDGWYPRLFVEIRNKSELPDASGSRLLTWLRANEKRTYIARSWLTKRGIYPLGPTDIISGDPFGFFKQKHEFPAKDSLLVLPMVVPIADFVSPAGFLPGGKANQRLSRDVTPHASGVREYQHGDAIKTIHWPSSAKRNKLMVKEFEQDPQSEYWIFLDAQKQVQAGLPFDPPKIQDYWILSRRPEVTLPQSTLEYSTCVGASLAHYFIQKRESVGFVTEDPVFTVIAAERSERQESKILEQLAFATGTGKLPLASLVDLQSPSISMGSCAILITPSVQDDILLSVELLQRRNIRPIVILLMAKSFDGKDGSELIAERLEQNGVPVCKIYNKSNLSKVLSNFFTFQRDKEYHPWVILP